MLTYSNGSYENVTVFYDNFTAPTTNMKIHESFHEFYLISH